MTDELHTFDPDWCIEPGAVLREFMRVANIDERQLAERCGVPVEQISGVLTATVIIDTALAAALVRGTSMDIDPQFWLNFERTFRDGLAAGKSWSPEFDMATRSHHSTDRRICSWTARRGWECGPPVIMLWRTKIGRHGGISGAWYALCSDCAARNGLALEQGRAE